MENNYLDATHELYKEAALSPQQGLCCTTSPSWQLPNLDIPAKMQEMNYGCGTTVHQRDLINQPTVLYVGVGGGMELLQFAYFSRRAKAVIGVDAIDEMLQVCADNLQVAAQTNGWFSPEFVDLRKGDALALPLENDSVDVAAQNCLFNIFKAADLRLALAEMHRVLKPNGKLIMSDPICEQPMPAQLRDNPKLRAECLSGAIPLSEYLQLIIEAGFGMVEIRARYPYRLLSPNHYETQELIFIESVEICAIKTPIPADGACVFTGKSAIYYGKEPFFDDGKGHTLLQNQPLAVCDKTASALSALKAEIFVSESTYFYNGGGCC